MPPAKSLYEVLGVTKADSCSAIKKAYLKLARVHHPDKGGDAETFKEITRASDILSDETKRRMYDETGMTDEQMMERQAQGGIPGFPNFEFNMNDLFGNMFRQQPQGRGPIRKSRKQPPSVQQIPIRLEQFYLGHTVNIGINRQKFCLQCDHTGAKTRDMCRKCNGQGMVSQVVQLGPMTMHTNGPCGDCQGKGERILETCNPCSGSGFISEQRSLTVKIIPGTRSLETIVFSEVCSDHPEFERPGDAHIQLMEDPSDPAFRTFQRTGDQQQHLATMVEICLSESLLGCVIFLDGHPGYDEGLFVRLPAGSFQDDVFCISGAGMPLPNALGTYGDLLITVRVQIKAWERSLFVVNAAESLPMFADKVRVTMCDEAAIQTAQLRLQ